MYHVFYSGSCNCYVIWNEGSGEAAIVDFGYPAGKMKVFTDSKGLKVRYLIYSHAHYDHVAQVEEYTSAYPEARLVGHEKELPLLEDPNGNLSPLFTGKGRSFPRPDLIISDGDTLTLNGENPMVFRVIDAPGHTPGSYCLLCDEEKLMVVGDVIFEDGGRGRTDFSYGDESAMLASLRRLMALDGEINFLPGHGYESTIGSERVFHSYP